MEPTPDPAAVFDELAHVVYSSEKTDEVFEAISRAACSSVPGCDHASIMLKRGDHFETVAASDETAREIDRAEIRLGEGPCMDAVLEESAQWDPDLTRDTPWPRFAAWIVENTAVRGSLGFRLVLDGEKLGALNLFADRANVLDQDAADQAAVFAAFASVALTASERGQDARTARSGLESNREIGKAVGLLMAFHRVDDRAAFEILRKTSQDLNIKLADVAAEVLAHHRKR